MEATKTAWGYSILSSGGTATAALTTVETKNTRIRINTILISGAASTDIITVTDANNVPIAAGACTDANKPLILYLGESVSIDGLKVGAAGATTGACAIFTRD